MSKTKISRQLRAALVILNASDELKRKILPFVDQATEAIDWNSILTQDLSGGTHAAVVWIQSIWIGESVDDLIGLSYALDFKTRVAMIEALKIAWDLE
jgi:hypothetical protein